MANGLSKPEKADILFVATMAHGATATSDIGFPKDWFREALGLSEERFAVINALEDEFPDPRSARGVIIGGSNFSAYEKHKWLFRLEHFIRELSDAETPLLGVCFGHQIVAKALGGTVEKGKSGLELGIVPIELTEEGTRDPLFSGMDKQFMSPTIHGDVVTGLPGGSTVLANNYTYPNQALAIGKNIRTVQFHPEMTTATISKIVLGRRKRLTEKVLGSDPSAFDAQYKQMQKINIAPVKNVLRNFMENVVARGA